MVALNPSNIKLRNKHIFWIDNHKHNTKDSFHKMVRFMRDSVTEVGDEVDIEKDVIEDFGSGDVGGNTFETIRWMDVDDKDSLLQIGISCCGKFLTLFVLRDDLYVIGYSLPKLGVGFYIDNGHHTIVGFDKLPMGVSYDGGLEKPVGIGSIVSAVHQLCRYDPQASREVKASYFKDAKLSLQAMFIHIAESTRFRAIENQIARTIKTNGEAFDIESNDDAEELTYETEHIDTDKVDFLPSHAQIMINNFSKLSNHWCKFVISNGAEFVPEDVLKIRTPSALREVLGVVKPDFNGLERFFSRKYGTQGKKKVREFFKINDKGKGSFKRSGGR